MESLPIDERRKYFGSMILGLVSELDEGVRDEVARLGGMVLRYYGDEVVVNREQLAEQIENGVEELGKRMPEAADVIKHAVGAFFEFEED